MKETISLSEAFNQVKYRMGGHGPRNVQVLLDALDSGMGREESDMYGKGKIIEQFQAKMASYLGKESAVFFPSGTMAQQIALRIWCDRKQLRKVAYHPLCHLEIHEEDGLKELHHIEPVLLADEERTIRADDLRNMKEEIACLLLELPQREIGGQLPNYEELEEIAAICRERGIKLHLDGARLFEILPYYRKTASEICALFDSVYISFYKGIGGIAGAILAGDETFTNASKVWKRRHGGDLISLYPYILSADKSFDQRIHKMAQYYEDAKELASLFNSCGAFSTKPAEPVSNMFHVHADLSKDSLEDILIATYEETGIGFTPYLKALSEGTCAFEIDIGDRYAAVPKDELVQAFHVINAKIKAIRSIA